MKLILSPTKEIVRIGGHNMPARVWTGTTDKGVPVRALIAFIGAAEGYDHAEFERELCSASAPLEQPLTVEGLVDILRNTTLV